MMFRVSSEKGARMSPGGFPSSERKSRLAINFLVINGCGHIRWASIESRLHVVVRSGKK